MTNQLESLNILPVNKTVVFYSPVEGNDVLVRTGTIGEGSCFFHSLLHAYSNDYVCMNNTGRMKFVKKLRLSISQKTDKDKWENLSKGLIATIPFQAHVNSLLTDFYKYISNGKKGSSKSVRRVIGKVVDENNKDAYKLVTEMVTLDNGFEKVILPSAYKRGGDKLSKCKKYIVKYASEYYKEEFKRLKCGLEQERIDFYIYKLKVLVQAIVDEAEDVSYNEYIESLKNVSTDIDSYTIGLISEKFNRDIFFIDGKTRMPYKDAGNIYKKRKSIIVMWTGGCHYEIVGKLLPGNRIQREFEFNDPLIKCIYTYLCNPEKIPDEYSSLTHYLPNELKKTLGIDVSDSDDECRSRSPSYKSEGEFISSDEDVSGYEKSDSENDEKIDKILNLK